MMFIVRTSVMMVTALALFMLAGCKSKEEPMDATQPHWRLIELRHMNTQNNAAT